MDKFAALVTTQVLWHKAGRRGRLHDGRICLELSIGDHCEDITEEFLSEITSTAKLIKLNIIKCPYISIELCNLIGKYISPKLVEL
jgi:hypothetical protein